MARRLSAGYAPFSLNERHQPCKLFRWSWFDGWEVQTKVKLTAELGRIVTWLTPMGFQGSCRASTKGKFQRSIHGRYLKANLLVHFIARLSDTPTHSKPRYPLYETLGISFLMTVIDQTKTPREENDNKGNTQALIVKWTRRTKF
jgi:hypothetical protein